jgi:hypothetical protein
MSYVLPEYGGNKQFLFIVEGTFVPVSSGYNPAKKE